MQQFNFSRLLPVGLLAICISSCSPTPGPDKSIAGAILGAGWGAGTGAIVGNQVDHAGPGVAIGAGVGAAAGLLTGIGLDVAESAELRQQEELEALRVQVSSNRQNLMQLQDRLDQRENILSDVGTASQIFFDTDSASLRLGSASQLERFANSIKINPHVAQIAVHGHSDDTGDTERNRRLSEARARTVVSFLSNQGLSVDTMRIVSHGAEQPIATNETDEGKQLNRRVEIVLLK
jgi:outer membrane protein OmpA-like peptidoglycan-associated protein